jgi:hypothetical protein
MPIEYSGYVAPKQVDWAALSSGLAKSFTDVGEAKMAKREELDKIAADNINKINEIEQGQNQTFGTMILDFQNNGREQINGWNQQLKAGTMTSADYKKRISNLSDYTGILASSAKTLDERISSAVQRQADGVASSYEIEMLKNIGSMAEIKDSKFFVSDSGAVVWSKVDPLTGAMVGEPKDVRTPNLPQNMVDNKVVVTDYVKEATKNWNTKQIFTDKGGGAYTNIESVKEQPFYQDMIAKVAIAATSSSRATLSILADNGVIDPVFYSTEAEKKAAIAERYAEMEELNTVAGRDAAITDAQRKEVENSLVKNTIGPDGTYNPELTKEQITLAQDHVKQEVDMQMQVKLDAQGRTQYAPQGGGGGGGQGGQAAGDYSLYQQITESWGQPGGAAALSAASGGKFVFEVLKGGGYTVRPAGAKEGTIGVTIKNQKDMAPYFFGSGTGAKGTTGTYPEYDRQANLYWTAKKGGGGSTTPTISNGNVR